MKDNRALQIGIDCILKEKAKVAHYKGMANHGFEAGIRGSKRYDDLDRAVETLELMKTRQLLMEI